MLRKIRAGLFLVKLTVANCSSSNPEPVTSSSSYVLKAYVTVVFVWPSTGVRTLHSGHQLISGRIAASRQKDSMVRPFDCGETLPLLFQSVWCSGQAIQLEPDRTMSLRYTLCSCCSDKQFKWMCEVGRWNSIRSQTQQVAAGKLEYAPTSPNRRRKKKTAVFYKAIQQGANFTFSGAIEDQGKQKADTPSQADSAVKGKGKQNLPTLPQDTNAIHTASANIRKRMVADMEKCRLQTIQTTTDGDLGSSSVRNVQHDLWHPRRNPNLPSDSGGDMAAFFSQLCSLQCQLPVWLLLT